MKNTGAFWEWLISLGALEGVGILNVSKLLHQANSEKKSHLSVCVTDTVLPNGDRKTTLTSMGPEFHRQLSLQLTLLHLWPKVEDNDQSLQRV